MKKNKKGFTLVELVVVVAVLLILAAIAVPTVLNVVNDAQKSADASTAASIETAIKYQIAQNEINAADKESIKDALETSGLQTTILTPKKAASFSFNKSTKEVLPTPGTGDTALPGTAGDWITIPITGLISIDDGDAITP